MSGLAHILAVGARTPVGLDAPSTVAAVRAGISGFQEFPFITANGDLLVIAWDTELDPRMETRERLVVLASSVLDEVAGKLPQDPGLWKRLPREVLLVLPEPRPGFSDEDARWVVGALEDYVGDNLPGTPVRIAGRGHAGPMQAVAGLRAAHASAQTLYLLVGAESYCHGETFIWLERHDRLAQPGVRSGFVPGEAAGCVALGGDAVARALGHERLASVAGVGTATESLLPGSETGSMGVGLTAAVTAATAGLRLPDEGVDVVYADINGERYRSEEWGFVALRTPDVWKTLDYQAPCDCWGDVGAAFAPLACVLAGDAYARGEVPGPRGMVIAGSDGGLRGALLLQAPPGT